MTNTHRKKKTTNMLYGMSPNKNERLILFSHFIVGSSYYVCGTFERCQFIFQPWMQVMKDLFVPESSFTVVHFNGWIITTTTAKKSTMISTDGTLSVSIRSTHPHNAQKNLLRTYLMITVIQMQDWASKSERNAVIFHLYLRAAIVHKSDWEQCGCWRAKIKQFK